MTQSFKEVEFPLDAEVTPVVVLYDSALSPFPNLEMQHNEKQSMLSWKNWGYGSCEKGFG